MFSPSAVAVIHTLAVCTRSVCLLSCCLLAPSAFGQKVKIDADPQTDFSRFRQYQWRTHPVFEKNPQLQEVYATGIQLVMEAGNSHLMKKGLQPVDSSPDIFVTFFLGAHGAEQVRVVDAGPAFGPYGWYGVGTWTTTEIDRYLQGLLVIDIVDAGTSKLVWRAYCGDQIRDMRKRDKVITAAVKKALERFPPKTK